jgi:hypothetical protein
VRSTRAAPYADWRRRRAQHGADAGGAAIAPRTWIRSRPAAGPRGGAHQLNNMLYNIAITFRSSHHDVVPSLLDRQSGAARAAIERAAGAMTRSADLEVAPARFDHFPPD